MWVAEKDPPQTIIIQDPAGTSYILDSEREVAHKMPSRPSFWKMKDGGEMKMDPAERGMPHPPMAVITKFKTNMDQKTEALGTQSIEGITAEGTRTIATIPAGEIGNEKPIEIISEKWYSPELQIQILTKNSDPRFGETTYRVTNIRRGEPDANLFEIPSNYKIEDKPVMFEKKIKKD
jgi:hypothetical protein